MMQHSEASPTAALARPLHRRFQARAARAAAGLLMAVSVLAAGKAGAVDVVDAGTTARGLTRVETRSLSIAQLSKLDVTLSVLLGSAYADVRTAATDTSVGLVPAGNSTLSPLSAGNYFIYIYSTVPGQYTLNALASAIPEPSGLALFASGLLLLLLHPITRKSVSEGTV